MTRFYALRSAAHRARVELAAYLHHERHPHLSADECWLSMEEMLDLEEMVEELKDERAAEAPAKAKRTKTPEQKARAAAKAKERRAAAKIAKEALAKASEAAKEAKAPKARKAKATA